MKIKKVGVIIQNYVQFESFFPAIELMNQKKINVDILLPTVDMSEHIWDQMYEKTKEYFAKNGQSIKKGVQPKIKYDILFATHDLEEFKGQDREYYIKFRYGISTKPRYSLTFRKNNPFDLILCYGTKDSETLRNFGKVYEIGNIKYANYDCKTNTKVKKEKSVVLYLPTYGDTNSCDIVIPVLSKLTKKYDIRIKLHHGTNYLLNEEEQSLKKVVNQKFNKIYDSSESLLNIMKDVDLIISDNSGAIGDAIAAKIPVVIVPKDGKFEKYGEYTTIQEELVEKKLVGVAYEQKEIEKAIKKELSDSKLHKKLEQAFKMLYSVENENTTDKFSNLLNEIENGLISKDYTLIRRNMQQEYKNFVKMNEEYEVKIEVLNERLKNAYKIIEQLEKNNGR